MALVNCKNCGAKVSEKAITCPKCGVDEPALSTISERSLGCAPLWL